MSLTKSKGNMYPWCTHTHTHLGGECGHRCSYCFVRAMAKRYPEMKSRYSGPLRLLETEFLVKYGEDRTIFIEHCNDLFASAVPKEFIQRILAHCREWPDNIYVFQTKNPARYHEFLDELPDAPILGTTMETNRWYEHIMGDAPSQSARYLAMLQLPAAIETFVTIEPILDFDLDVMVERFKQMKPTFVNIGADSKGHGLPEPPAVKVVRLIEELKKAGIEIREKHNLARLIR